LFHLVGYLYYWQMGFNSVFKGLSTRYNKRLFILLFPYNLVRLKTMYVILDDSVYAIGRPQAFSQILTSLLTAFVYAIFF